MKQFPAYLCLFLLCFLLTACGQAVPSPATEPPAATTPSTEPTPTEIPTEPEITEPEPTEPPTSPVIDMIKQFYEPDGTVTSVDYNRLTFLPMEGLNYLITWTVDVDESLIQIVPNEDGTVTVDINELCGTETPYTLTASVVNEDGIRVYHSWNYILPQARDMAEVLDEAYALPAREQLSYYATLTGKIVSIDKAWSEDYQNITLIMKVEAAGNRSVRCYGLTGDGTESLKIGDVITVTGILQRYGSIVEFDSGCKLQQSPPAPEEEG